SYRAFLAEFPDTDLSITARTMMERLRFKPVVAPQVAALCTPSTPSAPSSPAPAMKKADIAPSHEPVVIQQTPPVIIHEPPVIIKKVDVI
ncbi:hypothetical protein ABTH88_19560, partial [Acinetobacter baumannii]